jgi:hypothetical protein
MPSIQNLPEKEETWQSSAGSIYHRIMHALLTNPAQQENVSNISQGCLNALKRMGIFGENLQLAFEQVMLGVKQFLSDPLSKWLSDSSHLEKKMEWSIWVKDGQEIKKSIIDYSFVDKNNIRWIVDFKLSAFDKHDKAFAMEIEKYKPQLKKYYDAIRQREDREIKCGLYFPLQQSFKEILFEELAW